MKIVKAPSGNDAETIVIWDGPLVDRALLIAPGRDRVLFPTFGEAAPETPICYFTDRAFELNEPSHMSKLEYIRTDREDEEGRVYFAMKRSRHGH